MAREEINEAQRLGIAIQSAMRAMQSRGGNGHSSLYQEQGEGRVNELRERVKETVRERVGQQLQDKVREGVDKPVATKPAVASDTRARADVSTPWGTLELVLSTLDRDGWLRF